MFKRRKLLEKIKSSKAMREAESLEYNDMGRAIIEVGIKNADDFRKRLDAIKVGIYGSMVTGEATRYSDIDVLVMIGDDRDRMEAKR